MNSILAGEGTLSGGHKQRVTQMGATQIFRQRTEHFHWFADFFAYLPLVDSKHLVQLVCDLNQQSFAT
jgi:hypothetical protein